MEPIRLAIQGLASAASLEPVEEALRMVPGVMSVRPDSSGNVILVEAADTVRGDDLVAALLKAGFVAALAG